MLHTATFKVTNKNDQVVQISMLIDLESATKEQKEAWALSNRIIALQRVLRNLSVNEIKALNGSTILATDCGKKIKSRDEKLGEIKSRFGLDDETANWAVDHPAEFQQKLTELFKKEIKAK